MVNRCHLEPPKRELNSRQIGRTVSFQRAMRIWTCLVLCLRPALGGLQVGGLSCWREGNTTNSTCPAGMAIRNVTSSSAYERETLHLSLLKFVLHVPFEPFENMSDNSRK